MEPVNPEQEKKDKKFGKKQLALERTALAQERTLSAWVRTNASFITFGFAIYKLLQANLEETQQNPIVRFMGPRRIGMIMIWTGFIGLILAIVRHHRAMKTLDQFGKKHFSISLIMAYVMVGLSAFLIIASFLRN